MASPDELNEWAKRLAEAVGRDELRRLAARYRTLATSPAGTDDDRAVARDQAAALGRQLRRPRAG